MSDLIDRKALMRELLYHRGFYPVIVKRAIENAPTVDAVEVERYEELRESFVDYVCSGVPNPAPYCKNRCKKCTNQRGWCKYDDDCKGFNPV